MDDDKPAVPVDSRQTGFNPEVDAGAAEVAAAAATPPDPVPDPPPQATHRCGACGALFMELKEICDHCGVTKLVHEIP